MYSRDVQNYIQKMYKIDERPFPISFIQINADSHGNIRLRMESRTHLDHSLLKWAFEGINWKDFFIDSYSYDSFSWLCNLNRNNKMQINNLFEIIFTRLKNLTGNVTVKKRIQAIQEEIYTVLEMYCIFFPNKPSHSKDFIKNDLDYLQLDMSYDKLFNAVSDGNVEETHKLLTNGISPDLYYLGYTPLIAAIIFGIKKDKKNLSSIMSVITLLLEYGANPMLETWHKSAFEKTVTQSLTLSHIIHAEYFAGIIKLLTAAENFRPHVYVAEEFRKSGMGMIIHGSNCFFKDLKNIQNPNRIIGLDRDNELLTFYASDNLSNNRIITVKTTSTSDFKNENDWIHLFNLCKSAFPWKSHFTTENEFRDYLKPYMEHSSNILESVYLDGILVGFNISETIQINDDTEYRIHLIKLTVGDKVFCDTYKAFMSNLAFAESFALKIDHPDATILTFLEVASIFSYSQVKDIAFPRIQNIELNNLMNKLATRFYGDKIYPFNKSLYIEDPLAVAKSFAAPQSFWMKRNIVEKVYHDYYQIDGFSLLMGFYSSDDNLKIMEKKINMNDSAVKFRDIIQVFTNNYFQRPSCTSQAKL